MYQHRRPTSALPRPVALRAPLALALLVLAAVATAPGSAARAQDGTAPPEPEVGATAEEPAQQEPGAQDSGSQDSGSQESGAGATDDGGTPAGEAPAPVPVRRYALVGGTVHSMVAGAEPEVLTVLVTGDRIDAVGADLPIPLGVERIDCTGRHIVPGLIDALVLYQPLHDELYTAAGVTTVRDTGKNPVVVRQLMQSAYRDRIPGPHLSSAGAVFDGAPPTSPYAIVLESEADIGNYMPELARGGFDYVCLLPAIDPALLPSIYAQADALELDVWGMLPIRASLDTVLEGGHRGLFGVDALLPFNEATEVPFDRVPWEQTLPIAFGAWARSFAEHDVALVPLLVDSERFMRRVDENDAQLELLDFQVAAHWRADALAQRQVLDDPERGAEALEVARTRHARRSALAGKLSEAGATLVPGTSASNPWIMPGSSLHDELALWVEAGMAPYEVLRAATATSARVLGLGGRGTIRTGAIADMVVTTGDPRESLDSLREPEAVVVRGRRMIREDLDALVESLRLELERQRVENARPLDVAAPEAPEGAPLIEGRARCSIYGQRYQEERFQIVRTEQGHVTVVSRIVQPAAGGFAEGEIEIEQSLVDGLLVAFEVRVNRGFAAKGDEEGSEPQIHTMTVRGRWGDGRFNIERLLDGTPLGTRATPQRPVAVLLDSVFDTITCPIVVGQFPRDGDALALTFGENLEPVLVDWRIATLPDGTRVVASSASRFAVQYDDRGVPMRAIYESPTAAAQLAVDPDSVNDYGGAGLPVRFTVPDAPEPGPAPGGNGGGATGGAGARDGDG